MLYFSKLRILFITLFSVLFILIASSNLFKFDDDFFDKKINLGLDLQGGSYLLLEIDNEPVIEQKLQNLTTTIRNYFKEKNIKINNIKIDNQNIFFNVTDNDKQSKKFLRGISCPKCFDHKTADQKKRYADRQKQIDLAKSRNQKHLGSQFDVKN